MAGSGTELAGETQTGAVEVIDFGRVPSRPPFFNFPCFHFSFYYFYFFRRVTGRMGFSYFFSGSFHSTRG